MYLLFIICESIILHVYSLDFNFFRSPESDRFRRHPRNYRDRRYPDEIR